MAKSTSSPIFISHATADQPIVDALVTMLTSSGTANVDDIFCTSLEGMGIPAGKNFIEFIKNQLQEPQLVIMVISPHYLESQFCLCELGASWALSLEFYPIVVPPLTVKDCKAVLGNVIQCGMLDEPEKLSELRDRIVQSLGRKERSYRFEQRRDKFLDALQPILDKIDPPFRVDPKAHLTLKKENTKLKVDLEDAKAATDKLKQQIEKLKQCKDAAEVSKALVDDDEWSILPASRPTATSANCLFLTHTHGCTEPCKHRRREKSSNPHIFFASALIRKSAIFRAKTQYFGGGGDRKSKLKFLSH